MATQPLLGEDALRRAIEQFLNQNPAQGPRVLSQVVHEEVFGKDNIVADKNIKSTTTGSKALPKKLLSGPSRPPQGSVSSSPSLSTKAPKPKNNTDLILDKYFPLQSTPAGLPPSKAPKPKNNTDLILDKYFPLQSTPADLPISTHATKKRKLAHTIVLPATSNEPDVLTNTPAKKRKTGKAAPKWKKAT